MSGSGFRLGDTAGLKKIAAVRVTVLWVLASLVIGGCAETRLAIHAAKRITHKPPAQTRGTYKIGDPYRINGAWYYPKVDYGYVRTGIASWYGPNFHGKRTANGETFNMNRLTAAHKTLPLPSLVRVVNLRNGRAIVVRLNDRGPYARGRIIDLSRRAAQLLGFENQGTAPVRIEILAAESRRLALLAQRGRLPPAVARRDDRVRIATLDASGARTARPRRPAPAPRQVQAVKNEATDRQQVTVETVGEAKLFVQAGAFTRYEYAVRSRDTLTAVAPTRIVEAVIGRRTFYRVRIGPLASVEEGDRVLNEVIANGFARARIVAD
jgi:rare lipoprotein A